MASKHKKEHVNDDVIMGDVRVSVSYLKKKAARANRTFWAMLVCSALVMSMILPYMSLASGVAASPSDVFTGKVVPGYSMGGVEVSAYGIDLNEWGAISTDVPVESNYGIWSGSRFDNAWSNLKSDSNAFIPLDQDKSTNYNLTETDKSLGWQAITGRTGYTSANPNGTSRSNQSNQTDVVSPYRTVNDYNYWDSRTPTSNGNASADITVSLYADFVILAYDRVNDHVTTLRSPDDTGSGHVNLDDGKLYSGNSGGNNTDGDNTASGSSPAIPIYISLGDLMNLYSINDPEHATIDDLIDAIGKNPKRIDESFVDTHNLLHGTHYTPYQYKNGGGSASTATSGISEGDVKDSDAFNPYPYTMVFTANTSNGEVTSSMYTNSEAYVYFSPSSAYMQYMKLKQEYQDILDLYSDDQINNEARIAFQVGYYLAEMSILEAYLDEALPQDMTRGYVGPSEPTSVAQASSTHTDKTLADGHADSNITQDPKRVAYSTLMYDVAKNYNGNIDYNIGSTNSIMDTLSCFGYGINTSDDDTKSGVMKGMQARDAQSRLTLMTPYSTDKNKNAGASSTQEANADGSSGVYLPTYYPIQQHKMPDSEKAYRFQILAIIPYQTLLSYIKNDGFSGGVQFTYSNEDVKNKKLSTLSAITSPDAQKRVSELADMLNSGENTGKFIVNAGQYVDSMTSVSAADGVSGDDDDAGTAKRIDNALLAYQSDNMNADNVHDLFDVVRSVRNLKYETWIRFYNPIKSEGGDQDFFVTRISPAMTTYMPSVLLNGYTCAGSGHINSTLTTTNCSFDYYSTPSFAPCFASHTMDSCYYGVLNYEQRAFYSKDFLSSLDENLNIPAVQRQEDASKAVDDAKKAQSIDSATMWNNIKTIYTEGKRLAAIQAAKNISSGNATVNGDTLSNMNDASTTNGNYLGQIQIISNGGQTRENASADQLKGKVFAPVSADDMGANIGNSVKNNLLQDFNNEKFGHNFFDDDSQWLWSGSQDTVGQINAAPLNDRNKLGSTGSDNVYLSADNGDGTKIYISVNKSIYFSAVYDGIFKSYFDEDGRYYWTSLDNIKSQNWDTDQLEYNVTFKTGSIIGGALADNDKTLGDQDVTAEYESSLKNATSEMQKAITAVKKEVDDIVQSMPSQMQNCLAWGDYQNDSDSQNQYQEDPSSASQVNLTASNKSSDSSSSDQSILSINDAKALGWDLKDDGTLEYTGETTDEDSGIQARMVRGVEGSTWTSTKQPAEYTMSATIGRIDTMSEETGTNYPYSGIANGRLQSGTDRYAILQAHVIDYTSIASGIAGDLALIQHPKVVKVSNPEYSGISNFLDILGNIGAGLAEAGSTVVKGSASMFTSVFWGADTKSSDITDSSRSTSSASSIISAATGTTKYNHTIQMTRTPASNSTFDQNTGKLVDTSSASASAASNGIGIIDSTYVPWLLRDGTGFYSMMQSFGLIIVMVSLLVIGFQNFIAYATRRNEVQAQTTLKEVLPKSIMAIFMIGLPPINGGVGFEGGAYILLQLVNAVINMIAGIFLSLDSSSIMSVWSSIDVSTLGNDIAAYIVFFLSCITIALMFTLGTIIVFIQSIFLLVFYVVAPIVWGLYVWPYGVQSSESDTDANASKHPFRKSISDFTRDHLSFGLFSSKQAGSQAAAGWLSGYVNIALLTVGWALLFWVVSMLFVGTNGVGSSSAASATAAEMLANGTGFPSASASLLDGSFLKGGTGGGWAQMLFSTVVCVIAFSMMLKPLIDGLPDVVKNASKTTFQVASAIANGGKQLAKQTAYNAHDNHLDNRTNDIEKKIESTRKAGGPGSAADIAKLRKKQAKLEKRKDTVERHRAVRADLAPAVASTAKNVLKKDDKVGDAVYDTFAALGRSKNNDKKAPLEAENKEIKNLAKAASNSNPKVLEKKWNNLSPAMQEKLKKDGIVKVNALGNIEKLDPSAAKKVLASNDRKIKSLDKQNEHIASHGTAMASLENAKSLKKKPASNNVLRNASAFSTRPATVAGIETLNGLQDGLKAGKNVYAKGSKGKRKFENDMGHDVAGSLLAFNKIADAEGLTGADRMNAAKDFNLGISGVSAADVKSFTPISSPNVASVEDIATERAARTQPIIDAMSSASSAPHAPVVFDDVLKDVKSPSIGASSDDIEFAKKRNDAYSRIVGYDFKNDGNSQIMRDAILDKLVNGSAIDGDQNQYHEAKQEIRDMISGENSINDVIGKIRSEASDGNFVAGAVLDNAKNIESGAWLNDNDDALKDAFEKSSDLESTFNTALSPNGRYTTSDPFGAAQYKAMFNPDDYVKDKHLDPVIAAMTTAEDNHTRTIAGVIASSINDSHSKLEKADMDDATLGAILKNGGVPSKLISQADANITSLDERKERINDEIAKLPALGTPAAKLINNIAREMKLKTALSECEAKYNDAVRNRDALNDLNTEIIKNLKSVTHVS